MAESLIITFIHTSLNIYTEIYNSLILKRHDKVNILKIDCIFRGFVKKATEIRTKWKR